MIPKYTGDSFRSSVLGVMSPARLPLRHAGKIIRHMRVVRRVLRL